MTDKLKAFLTDVFGRNAVKKALTWLLIIAVATVVVITQFAFPVSAEYRYAKIYKYNKSFDLMIKSAYEDLKAEGSDKLLSDTDFDMSNPDDYIRIELYFEFKNIGMYKISDIQFVINSIGVSKERFVFKETNFANVDRFNSGKVPLTVIMNVSGMSDEEINAAVNSLEISYTFNRPELFPSGGEIEMPQISLPLGDITEEKNE